MDVPKDGRKRHLVFINKHASTQARKHANTQARKQARTTSSLLIQLHVLSAEWKRKTFQEKQPRKPNSAFKKNQKNQRK